MKGMTFENFRVDHGNRAAYDYCRRAATLQYDGGRTVVLLGPEGAGKSHLLWSIVKHIRASSARAGLALVMASEFPEQVRQLAVNPAPIQDDKPALLLVDDLQAFSADAHVLEGVVKAFLANGHGVLLASSVHPDRLALFTEPFRATLCHGEVLEMRPAAPLPVSDDEELESIEALRAERDALEQKLAHKANESAELAQVKLRLDEAMRQVEQLTLALADTSRFDALAERHQAELAAVAAERDGYRQGLNALHEERDHLERLLAERTAAAAQDATHGEALQRLSDEGIALRARLAQAEEIAARANETQAALQERINHLQAEMSEYRGGLEEARDLRRQLEEAQSAAQLERASTTLAVRTVSELESLLDAERQRAQAELDHLRGEVNALIAAARARGPVDTRELDLLREELNEARGMSAAFRSQMDQDRRSFEEETSQLRAENAQLHELAQRALAEQGRSAATLESSKARIRSLEYDLDRERKHNQFLTAEMEALRSEAATQVAQANLQASELEAKTAQLRDALDVALHRGKSAAAHAEALAAAFDQATLALAAAREDLNAIEHPDAAADTAAAPAPALPQASLFDTAPFMRELASLPDAFESPNAMPELSPAPAIRPLHELVDEVLAQEGTTEA